MLGYRVHSDIFLSTRAGYTAGPIPLHRSLRGPSCLREFSFYFLSTVGDSTPTNECTYLKGPTPIAMHPAFFLVYIFPTRRAMKILLALGATTGVHASLTSSLRPRAVVTQLRRVEVGTCSVTIRPAGYSSVYSRDITGTCTGYRPTNRSVEEFHRVCYVRCRPR